jgi:methyl-accepting chemotaxis protein
VRALAQRSATAAKEIKGLIAESVQRIEAGTAVVAGAGKTMDEILSINRQVNQIIHDIAQASVEQSDGIVQIKRAIEQMDNATQQNGELVSSLAVATDSMSLELQQLTRGVDFFRIADDTPQAAASASELNVRRGDKTHRKKPLLANAGDERKTQLASNASADSDWQTF